MGRYETVLSIERSLHDRDIFRLVESDSIKGTRITTLSGYDGSIMSEEKRTTKDVATLDANPPGAFASYGAYRVPKDRLDKTPRSIAWAVSEGNYHVGKIRATQAGHAFSVYSGTRKLGEVEVVLPVFPESNNPIDNHCLLRAELPNYERNDIFNLVDEKVIDLKTVEQLHKETGAVLG